MPEVIFVQRVAIIVTLDNSAAKPVAPGFAS